MHTTGSDAGENEAVPSTVSDHQKRNEAQSREAVIAEAAQFVELYDRYDPPSPDVLFRLVRDLLALAQQLR